MLHSWCKDLSSHTSQATEGLCINKRLLHTGRVKYKITP
uniref:Uncharacterized protein n=1 Tax=Anguilla anguilla TaxID=7936 RepID=A0A0E9VHR4_ANGAN